MIVKRVLCPQRLRRVPRQFSWIDQRLVREGHIARCSHRALALYLFLVTVGDAQGLSYYSERAVCGLLRMRAQTLAEARGELCQNGLIAYQAPLYQVLSLEDENAGLVVVSSDAGPRRGSGVTRTLGVILGRAMEEKS